LSPSAIRAVLTAAVRRRGLTPRARLRLDKLSGIVYIIPMKATNNSTIEYSRDEHRVHLIVYHLIWCPKRRKPILVGKFKDRLQELLEAKCQEQGWKIMSLAILPDHIHIVVRVWPRDSAADVIKDTPLST
jgi:putative transposase